MILTEPQEQMMRLNCRYPLFVAGYGSGKTACLIVNAISDLYMFPGARVGTYSDTYDQLRLNIIPRVEEMLLEAGVKYQFNKSENVISTQFHGKLNELIFRSIDNPKRIIGYEVYRSHVDEIEAATSERKAVEVWRKIIARNRQKHEGYINKVSAYTTPDQGFGFTYKRWAANSGDYRYVRASTESNRANIPPGYIEALFEDYGETLARAYISGEWCNLTSGTVYTAFTREHCNSSREVRTGEPLHIGMDFNVQNMAAIVFVMDVGHAVAVDEMIGYLDTPSVISAIKHRYGNHSITIYPDASGGNTSSKGASLSDIILLRQAGFTVRAPAANPRVRERIVCVNSRLADNTVRVNTRKCPQTTECLEKQAYNDNGEPDKTAGYDHATDAFGYFTHYNFPLRARAATKIMAR